MPRHKFNRRSLQTRYRDPIMNSYDEVKQEQKVFELQQQTLNKEKEIVLKDLGETMEKFNESQIKKKLQEILMELPKQDRLRNSLDKEHEEKLRPETKYTLM